MKGTGKSIPNLVGIETEYGIMVVNANQSDPFLASDMLLDAFSQIDEAAVPCATSFSRRGYRRSSSSLFLGSPRKEKNTAPVSVSKDLMLGNGARFYIDHAHPEYSTPECLSPRQLVAADKAGEHLVAACRNEANSSNLLPPDQFIQVYKNNSDYKNNSYGCHENYLLTTGLFTDLLYRRVHRLFRVLLPFLVTRIIFCGSGKVGAENGTPPTGFQLSQRADFFETLIGLDTTRQRPLFNTRDEPHANSACYRRLHVIPGDANMAEYSTYLKVGTMQLVLQMLEDDFLSLDLTLSDPIRSIQTVSRDLSFRRTLELEGGSRKTALEIQSIYLEQTRQYLEQRSDSEEQWEVWHTWEQALAALPDDAEKLSFRLDWAIKRRILERYLKSSDSTWEEVAAWQPIIEATDQSDAASMAKTAGLDWDDYDRQRTLYFGLRRRDLEYHDIRHDTEQGEVGLFYRLQNSGAIERLITDEEIVQMKTQPPANTRAWLRGQCIRRFYTSINSADWEEINFSIPISGEEQEIKVILPDPLAETAREWEAAWPEVRDPAGVILNRTTSISEPSGESTNEQPGTSSEGITEAPS